MYRTKVLILLASKFPWLNSWGFLVCFFLFILHIYLMVPYGEIGAIFAEESAVQCSRWRLNSRECRIIMRSAPSKKLPERDFWNSCWGKASSYRCSAVVCLRWGVSPSVCIVCDKIFNIIVVWSGNHEFCFSVLSQSEIAGRRGSSLSVFTLSIGASFRPILPCHGSFSVLGQSWD